MLRRERGDTCMKRKQKLIAMVIYANLYLQGKNDKKISLNARNKFPELYEPTKGNMRKTISNWGQVKKELKKAA